MLAKIVALLVLVFPLVTLASGDKIDPFDENRVPHKRVVKKPHDRVFNDEHKICKDRWFFHNPSDPVYCSEIQHLERFNITDLRYVGIVEKDGDTWALLSEPTGAINRVTIGNLIGKDHGKIRSIAENYIVFTEILSDGEGGWMQVCSYIVREEYSSLEFDLPKLP